MSEMIPISRLITALETMYREYASGLDHILADIDPGDLHDRARDVIAADKEAMRAKMDNAIERLRSGRAVQ